MVPESAWLHHGAGGFFVEKGDLLESTNIAVTSGSFNNIPIGPLVTITGNIYQLKGHLEFHENAMGMGPGPPGCLVVLYWALEDRPGMA